MKQVAIVLSLISSLALAETATITVEGMHCSGCKAMVTKNVCENTAIKNNSESCEVKLVDEDKQIGQVTIVSKKDTKVDVEAVKAGVKAAGDDYKVAKIDVKEMITKDLKTETAANMKAGETVTTTTTETVTKEANGKITKEVKMKKIKKMAKKMKPATEAAAKTGTTTTETTETKKETK